MECQNPKSVHMSRIELLYIRFSKIILLHAFPLGYLSVLCTWPSGMLTFLSAPCMRPCRPKHQISVHFASGLWLDFQNICLFWDPTFEPYVGGPGGLPQLLGWHVQLLQGPGRWCHMLLRRSLASLLSLGPVWDMAWCVEKRRGQACLGLGLCRLEKSVLVLLPENVEGKEKTRQHVLRGRWLSW